MNKNTNKKSVAMAIAAHPDDIEFLMAGTLLALKAHGFETHYMTVANGCCGSEVTNAEETASIREKEARAAAEALGAVFHESLSRDLEIGYDTELIRRLGAVIREVRPDVLLVPSPQDYMEDHVQTARLAVTAAFSRGMQNFETIPPVEPNSHRVTLYHALPHGLRDGMRQKILPEFLVDTTMFHDTKKKALACHKSQDQWLSQSQEMSSYLLALDEMSMEVAEIVGCIQHAEGWRRHAHYGFCGLDDDPLKETIGYLYLPVPQYLDRINHWR